MGSTGAAIGRGLNLAARFAAGAGAFDRLGGPGSIAQTGVNLLAGGASPGMGSISSPSGPTIGERVRGGFSAISPTFANAENIRSLTASRQSNIALDQARVEALRRQTEADNTPYDLQKLTGIVDPSGNLGSVITDELMRVGADVDNNTITTQKEVNKALASGKVDFGKINKAFDKAISDTSFEAAGQTVAYNSAKDKIKMNLIKAGQQMTDQEIEQAFSNAGFRATYSKEAMAFDKMNEAKKRIKLLNEKKTMLGSYSKPKVADTQQEVLIEQARADVESGASEGRNLFEQTKFLERQEAAKDPKKDAPVSKKKLEIMESEEFQSDLAGAMWLINAIDSGKDVDITKAEIINRLQLAYTPLHNDIRAMIDSEAPLSMTIGGKTITVK